MSFIDDVFGGLIGITGDVSGVLSGLFGGIVDSGSMLLQLLGIAISILPALFLIFIWIITHLLVIILALEVVIVFSALASTTLAEMFDKLYRGNRFLIGTGASIGNFLITKVIDILGGIIP